MLKIGLTGGIGSGKTTAARIFEVLGVPVYYADEAARRLMETEEELKAAIRNQFGEEVYPGGRLDRAFLSRQVFGHPKRLKQLNALVHPVTIRDAAIWMKNQEAPYVIKEAALIFESGSNKELDYVIGVSAPEEIRIRRTMERDHSAREAVEARMRSQMPEEEKMKRCDFVLVNDDRQLLTPQVLELDHSFRKMAGSAEVNA